MSNVKPLLSAEEWMDALEINVMSFEDDWNRSPQTAFALFKKRYASQLQPPSPQLEQEVKRLQEENERLKGEAKEQEDELVEDILSKFRSIGIDTSNWEQEFGDGRFAHEFIAAGVESVLDQKNTLIKELEQQLSQSDAVEEIRAGIVQMVKDNIFGFGKWYQLNYPKHSHLNDDGILDVYLRETGLLSPQSPTPEEEQKDPEQQ